MANKMSHHQLQDWERDFMVYPLDYELFFETQDITKVQEYLKNMVGKKCKVMIDPDGGCAYINDNSKQYMVICYQCTEGLGILVHMDENNNQEAVAIEIIK